MILVVLQVADLALLVVNPPPVLHLLKAHLAVVHSVLRVRLLTLVHPVQGALQVVVRLVLRARLLILVHLVHLVHQEFHHF